MFTTGSKFFLGAALVGAAASIVFAASSGKPYFTGAIVLLSITLVAVFLGGIVSSVRDADRPAVAGAEAPAPEHQVAPYSVWPILTAFAAGVLVLGIAIDRRALILGLAGLLVLGIEWVVQSWADGASAEPGYNRAVRGRIMHAVEFPVFGALGVGFVGFLFSRLMLTLNEHAAVGVFIALGAIILGGAVILAQAPGVAKKALPVFLALGAAGLLAGGVVGISRGEADHKELLDKTGHAVADKANPEAVITIAGGKLSTDKLTVPKNTVANLLFRNDDAGERELVVVGLRSRKEGTQTITEPFTAHTEAIGEGKVALLSVQLPKSGLFDFYVTDATGNKVASGKVVVP